MLLSGTPVRAASWACARRWRHSPWTGMKLRGLTRLSTYSSSPAGACPDTCTSALPRCTTLAPSRVSSLMTRFTAVSFPGTSDEARITVSPSAIRIGWSRAAIRASADIGSPCDPVGRQFLGLAQLYDQPSGHRRHPQVAELPGDAHVPHHGPADQRHLAPVRGRGVHHLLDPVHVAGEAGHDDALLRF